VVLVHLAAVSVLRNVSYDFGKSSLYPLHIGFLIQSPGVDGTNILAVDYSDIRHLVEVLESRSAIAGGCLHRSAALVDRTYSSYAGRCGGAHAG
jgi:hypothetical protein